jgi:streptogramin lyase
MNMSYFRNLSSSVTLALLALAVAAPASLLAQRGSSAPPEHANVAPVNYRPHPYETQLSWGRLPDGRTWGSVSALNVDIDGRHIWAGDRCGTNSCATTPNIDPIVRLDPYGTVVQSFGAGQIIWPHGMDVDAEGNVWIADARLANENEIRQNPASANLGSVVRKFSPEGRLLMTIGTPGRTGTPPTGLTDPSDVLVAPDGSIFITEAHGDQFLDTPEGGIGRVSKWSPDGHLIKTFGTWGYGPNQFRGAHSLAMDSQGRLFIADRGNRRIQIFDQDANHLETWYQFSRISGLYIDSNDVLYAIDSESDENYNPGWRKGLRVGSARTGEVWYYVPEHASARASGMGGVGAMGEGVTADMFGNVIAGEVGPVQGLTKFVPRLIGR